MTVIFLLVDREAQDDLLLWPSVARSLGRARPRALVVLHSPGETVWRALESAGFDAPALLGDEPAAAYPISRRALIAENRKAAATLTDEGVAAVPFLGSARSVLGGTGTTWLAQTIGTGAVPVIASVTADGTGAHREMDLEQAARRLFDGLGGKKLVVRLGRASGPIEAISEGLSHCVVTVSGLEAFLLRVGTAE